VDRKFCWYYILSFILSYIIGKEIVFLSHGKTDPNWLRKEYNRVALLIPESWKFQDSIELAHVLLGKKQSVSLDSLSKRYGIERYIQNQYF
jgi:hypothetical protein